MRELCLTITQKIVLVGNKLTININQKVTSVAHTVTRILYSIFSDFSNTHNFSQRYFLLKSTHILRWCSRLHLQNYVESLVIKFWCFMQVNMLSNNEVTFQSRKVRWLHYNFFTLLMKSYFRYQNWDKAAIICLLMTVNSKTQDHPQIHVWT